MLGFENRVMNEEKDGCASCFCYLWWEIVRQMRTDEGMALKSRLLVQRVEMLLFHRSMGPATCSIGVHLPSH